MTPRVSITVAKGDPQELKRRATTIALPVVERLLQRAAPIAQRDASADAPRDTFALAHSIRGESRGLMMRTFSTLAQALPSEFGRRPGRKQPPLAALRGWAQRHGIDDELLFPLARAIARRGVKGRFFLKRARERMQSVELPRLIMTAAREIEDAWVRR